jgi:hypothetical protein
MMPRYRKRPVEIEAVQFPADTHERYFNFYGHPVHVGDDGTPFCLIETNHGVTRLNPTDWLITTAVGEEYPCSNAELEHNYEPSQNLREETLDEAVARMAVEGVHRVMEEPAARSGFSYRPQGADHEITVKIRAEKLPPGPPDPPVPPSRRVT